jgi:hydroxymethylbilane synthase
LKGGIVSIDGKKRISFQVNGFRSEPERIGEELAALVLAAGGKEILAEIKNQINK